MSQVGRYHVLSGNPTTRDTYDDLFGHAPFSLTFLVPPLPGGLPQMLPDRSVEAWRTVLREATLLPLFEIFADSRIRVEGVQHGASEAFRQLPRRTVDRFGWTRLCRQCHEEDEATFGVPVTVQKCVIRPRNDPADVVENADPLLPLLQVVKHIPNCDLDALWRDHYGAMKRLLQHDPLALSRLQKHLERRVNAACAA